jgi:hypothetical protein
MPSGTALEGAVEDLEAIASNSCFDIADASNRAVVLSYAKSALHSGRLCPGCRRSRLIVTAIDGCERS